MRELEANAVTFDGDYIETFSVRMKYGQSMMNKGGRRHRPTWHLGVNGYRNGKRIYDARSGLNTE